MPKVKKIKKGQIPLNKMPGGVPYPACEGVWYTEIAAETLEFTQEKSV